MKTAIVKFYFYDSKTRKMEFTFSIRVFEQGGFEVVEGDPGEATLDDFNNHPALALPDGKRRILPDAGLEWAKAVTMRYRGSYCGATYEEEGPPPDRSASKRSALVTILKEDRQTHFPAVDFSVRVYDNGGFDVVQYDGHKGTLKAFMDYPLPASDGSRMVSSEEGLIWAEALLKEHKGPSIYVAEIEYYDRDDAGKWVMDRASSFTTR